jgi:cellulose synthase/poly-beta-1,6-N-acetylglucosamine synthase-like glycosyltransferase
VHLVRGDFDAILIFLGLQALFTALLITWVVHSPFRSSRTPENEPLELIGTVTGAYLLSLVLAQPSPYLLPGALTFLFVAAFMRKKLPHLTMAGVSWLTMQPFVLILTGTWTLLFIGEQDFPTWMQRMAVLGLVVSVVAFALGFAERFARQAIMTHHDWTRPTAPNPDGPLENEPRVSIQLACYAEPPSVVMATMDRLAALEYSNYEVMVCDNNTADESLWRPLETHCRRLNRRIGEERFRFFHVAPLQGAKAGALNWCMERMDMTAELIAVIDADYLAEPDFLKRLVGFFDDANIAYVQTPHDYRLYEDSPYLSACYWEYMPNNKLEMAGVNEYGAAFTIGTMCILRHSALREAGGWAEWCLTEDSEVSVRLRALGYEGVYLTETFGRGLIPETFDDYKKQRFRWTAGPVQQLVRHWRLFLPAPAAAPLPGWSKLLEIARCAGPLRTLAAGFAAVVTGVASIVSILTGAMPRIDIPDTGWLLLGIGATTFMVTTWHRYDVIGCTRLRDMVRGEIARISLTYVSLLAGIAGLSSKPLAWRRTPKFKVESAGREAMRSAMPEAIVGGTCVALALALLAVSPWVGVEFALLCVIGLSIAGFRFLCAPYMAWLGIRHVNKGADEEQTDFPSWPTPGPGEQSPSPTATVSSIRGERKTG